MTNKNEEKKKCLSSVRVDLCVNLCMHVGILEKKEDCLEENKNLFFFFLPSKVTRPSLSESIAANALLMAESSLFAFEWYARNSSRVINPSLSLRKAIIAMAFQWYWSILPHQDDWIRIEDHPTYSFLSTSLSYRQCIAKKVPIWKRNSQLDGIVFFRSTIAEEIQPSHVVCVLQPTRLGMSMFVFWKIDTAYFPYRKMGENWALYIHSLSLSPSLFPCP